MTRFDGRLEPLAVATRSGLEESVHEGAGVALDPGEWRWPRSAIRTSWSTPDRA